MLKKIVKSLFKKFGIYISKNPILDLDYVNKASILDPRENESNERPLPFVLISSKHGPLIINTNDYNTEKLWKSTYVYGVGYQIMSKSAFSPNEVRLLLQLLVLRKKYFGSGVIAIDCGANIGVHTIEWAKLMFNWGSVYSFEAQEKIYYALCGNIIINNCLNVVAKNCVLGAKSGSLRIPVVDYAKPASFGSLELKERKNTEDIGQKINYQNSEEMPMITLDSLNLERIDLIKLDVEGMEEDVLDGSFDSISKNNPILYVELIKSNKVKILDLLKKYGYVNFPYGENLIAIHSTDPITKNIISDGNKICIVK
jgi:FkbM family methyltransferase